MALILEQLSVRLGGRTVLDAVSLALPPGEVTVVLGANGAGKSTLARAALALVRPSGGRVRIDGDDVATLPPRERARRIGYLPQSAEVHWNLRVRDLVALGRLPHEQAGNDADVIGEALAATRTVEQADRMVGTLSGGERARVLLARALAGEPQWLIADEPLASLDPAHQLDTLRLLRAVADRGTGVLLVLHDLTQAARIADHVAILKHGRLLASGVRDAVLTASLLEEAYGTGFAFLRDGAGNPVIVAGDRGG